MPKSILRLWPVRWRRHLSGQEARDSHERNVEHRSLLLIVKLMDY